MKNALKKISAIAMAFTMLGTGTNVVKSATPKSNNALVAHAENCKHQQISWADPNLIKWKVVKQYYKRSNDGEGNWRAIIYKQDEEKIVEGFCKSSVCNHKKFTKKLSRTVYPKTPAFSFINGDVNFDGKVDVSDVVTVMSHINGIKALTDEQICVADVKTDNRIDIEDATKIINHVKGIKALD